MQMLHRLTYHAWLLLLRQLLPMLTKAVIAVAIIEDGEGISFVQDWLDDPVVDLMIDETPWWDIRDWLSWKKCSFRV